MYAMEQSTRVKIFMFYIIKFELMTYIKSGIITVKTITLKVQQRDKHHTYTD